MTVRTHLRTPAGTLGIATLIAVAMFSVANLIGIVKAVDASQRTECIARELAQPWIGLKESFAAPPGDEEARARALKAITRGIERLENVNERC